MKSDPTRFPSTHWSLIEVARGRDEDEAQRALEDLCGRYWYPIYAYLRRSGRSSPDAEDLTQAFFARVVAENAFGSADQELGRLRSYLLGVLKRVLSDEQRNRGALKRRGRDPALVRGRRCRGALPTGAGRSRHPGPAL
jgi:RNA polymerase sigma-70 factor (ECF subfamily)